MKTSLVEALKKERVLLCESLIHIEKLIAFYTRSEILAIETVQNEITTGKDIKKPVQKTTSNAVKKSKQVSNKTFICKKCGRPFIPTGNRQRYCSEKCGLKHKPNINPQTGVKSDELNEYNIIDAINDESKEI